jgi:lipopolysaccharide transport system permease protein
MTPSESTLEPDAATEVAAVASVIDADRNPAYSSGPHNEPSLTVIQAKPGWQIVDFGELWRFRELLGFLVWRDVKVRYKQTVLGAAWAVLQPFAQMVVFSLFFGRLAEMPSGSVPYPLFVFAALLPWTFFANSITTAGGSLISHQNMITKVYFPRLFMPASVIGAALVDFAIACGMLACLMAYYQVIPSWTIVALPVVLTGLALAATGVGTMLSALTVSYRDFRYVVPFMIQIWMFATPCIYMDVASKLSPRWQWVLPLNPAYGLIENFRNATLGRPLNGYSLAVSLTMAALVLFAGCMYFRRVERTFADII